MIRCARCGGAGKIAGYRHVAGGICFECDGTGAVEAEAPARAKRRTGDDAIWAEARRQEKALEDLLSEAGLEPGCTFEVKTSDDIRVYSESGPRALEESVRTAVRALAAAGYRGHAKASQGWIEVTGRPSPSGRP